VRAATSAGVAGHAVKFVIQSLYLLAPVHPLAQDAAKHLPYTASDPHSSGLHIQGTTPAAVEQATYLSLLLFGFKTGTVPDTGQPCQFGLALVLQISAGGTASLLLTAIVSSARKRQDIKHDVSRVSLRQIERCACSSSSPPALPRASLAPLAPLPATSSVAMLKSNPHPHHLVRVERMDAPNNMY
jgi:hypothetical protein